MWRNIPLTVSQGVAGICPAYANSNYVVKELVHAYKISEASHILVAPALLPIATGALESLGYTAADVARRIIVLAHAQDVPADIRSAGWKCIDDLVIDETIPLPERFDGADAQETASIFFSSGDPAMRQCR